MLRINESSIEMRLSKSALRMIFASFFIELRNQNNLNQPNYRVSQLIISESPLDFEHSSKILSAFQLQIKWNDE